MRQRPSGARSTAPRRRAGAQHPPGARGRAASGQPILPRADRIQYEELGADLKRHYEATGRRNLKEYAYRVKHLDRVFTGQRAATIGQPAVDAYIVHRQTEGAGSTIKREWHAPAHAAAGLQNGKVLPMFIPKDGRRARF
jgi:hypothetical protein